MEYEDFVVQIERGRAGYRAHVLASPAGEDSNPFVPPYEAGELVGKLREMDDTLRAVRHLRLAAAESVGVTPREVGTRLYQALFAGPVGNLLHASRGRTEGAHRGLRIRLRFDLHEPELAWLSEYPWDLIYQPQPGDFLSLHTSLRCVRHLELPRPSGLPPFKPPLRLLVLIANPRGSIPLNLVGERKKLEKVLDRPGEIEPAFVERATFEKLGEALDGGGFHVLHFMGHGSFDTTKGCGGLLLETANGEQDLIEGPILADLIKGPFMPSLIVLNACETARFATAKGLSPFAGVATALVQGGALAVVAMQFSISDEAANAFAGSFYPQIAARAPVDDAVAAGRHAISRTLRGSMEWATPALFLRAQDGHLFGRPEAQSLALGTQSPAELNLAVGLRLLGKRAWEEAWGPLRLAARDSREAATVAQALFGQTVALLAGRSWNALRPGERRDAERLLISAMRRTGDWLPPLVGLAVLEADYYAEHGLVGGSGVTVEAAVRQLAAHPLPPRDLDLLALMPMQAETRVRLGLPGAPG